jgi:hypothetical protein
LTLPFDKRSEKQDALFPTCISFPHALHFSPSALASFSLEMDLHAALNFFIIGMVATARAQLESALAEVDTKRVKELADVAEQRAKVDTERAELQREIEAMQIHKEQQDGRIRLNVGGYRYDTSVPTLRRVPDNLFDAYFSGRYAQNVCEDGSIFIDRDGMLFGHVLEYMRDGVVSVMEQDELSRMGLLRRLKREFSYFLIKVDEEQAGGTAWVELYCADASNSLHQGHGTRAQEKEDSDTGSEEDTETDVEEEEENSDARMMTAAEAKSEVIKRNMARRNVEGDLPNSKWCSKCFEDKALEYFAKDTKKSSVDMTNARRVVQCRRMRRRK